MSQPGKLTLAEILSQPQVWAGALDRLKARSAEMGEFFQQQTWDSVFFTGCGSTYYLSLAAAGVHRALTGKAACGLPASEIWLYARDACPASGKHLLVAVSRSGTTTETLRAVQAFRDRDAGPVVTICCDPHAPLSRMGDLNLVLPEAREESVAQTRAFSTLFLAAQVFSVYAAGRPHLIDLLELLPENGRRLVDRYQPFAAELGRDLEMDRFYFLGGGLRYGLACEISLKMKEMSLTHSEPFHFMEFRHGPMSMVTPHTVIAGLVSQSNASQESAVLEEMAAKGARVVSLGETGASILFESGLDEILQTVLYLPFLQLMAFYRSIQKGLNSDRLNNLTAVVVLP